MSREQRQARRAMEQALLGKLPARRHRQLREHLRANEGSRAEYDRMVEALRELEHAEGHVELERNLVEDLVLDEIAPQTPAAWGPRWRLWAAALGTVATVAVVALIVRSVGEDGFGVRGSGGSGLAIEAMCVRAGSGSDPAPVRAAPARPCTLDQTLTFAYRVGALRGPWLSLFGVGSDDAVLYYAPTPAGDSAVGVSPSGWTPVPLAVRLAVNHVPGPVRLYGIVTPVPPDVEDIDAWAAALVEEPTPQVGDERWHVRLGRALGSDVCPTPRSCDSAELSFDVMEDKP